MPILNSRGPHLSFLMSTDTSPAHQLTSVVSGWCAVYNEKRRIIFIVIAACVPFLLIITSHLAPAVNEAIMSALLEPPGLSWVTKHDSTKCQFSIKIKIFIVSSSHFISPTTHLSHLLHIFHPLYWAFALDSKRLTRLFSDMPAIRQMNKRCFCWQLQWDGPCLINRKYGVGSLLSFCCSGATRSLSTVKRITWTWNLKNWNYWCHRVTLDKKLVRCVLYSWKQQLHLSALCTGNSLSHRIKSISRYLLLLSLCWLSLFPDTRVTLIHSCQTRMNEQQLLKYDVLTMMTWDIHGDPSYLSDSTDTSFYFSGHESWFSSVNQGPFAFQQPPADPPCSSGHLWLFHLVSVILHHWSSGSIGPGNHSVSAVCDARTTETKGSTHFNDMNYLKPEVLYFCRKTTVLEILSGWNLTVLLVAKW